MGIGRKEFLRLVSLTLGGLAINPLRAVVTANDVYINKQLGIMFTKPPSWAFVHVKDFGKMKDAQILGNGWDEEKDSVWEELGDPICIVTKYYPETVQNKGIFSPTITLQITPKHELEDLGHESFEELIEMSHFGTRQILKDFNVVKSYEPYFISGCKFYEYDAEYLFEHKDINESLKVELKALTAEHNGFYYDFNCHQSSAQDQTAHEEFELFKKSIKLI